MRKILLLVLFVTFAAAGLQAQTMNIRKTDGSVVRININEIKSIDYSGGQSSSYSSNQKSVSEIKNAENLSVAPDNMKAYRGNNGKFYAIRVTGRTTGRIWGGSDEYTDDSDIATAAVHVGVLSPGQTGVVLIEVCGGRSSYPSVTRNGITSTAFGQWDGSYRFHRP